MSAATPTPKQLPGSPYQVPPEPNRWPSIVLATVMHAALLAFLWVGISWQNTEPVSVEAEVWDMKTQAAAPPPPPPVQEETPPAPEPVPTPKLTPPPPPVEEKVVPKAPDIALEREKQRKLQREQERKEQELADRAEQKRQDAADKLAREKAELKKQQDIDKKLAQKKQQELDRKAQELADKAAEKKEAEKLAADKKKAADKLAKAKEAAEDKKIKDMLNSDMRRIASQASGNGTSGTAEKSTASRIDSGYVASITSAIKSRSSYAGDTDVPGNPKVVFHVEQLPTGEIISVRKTKSSGIPEFDRAVENAINKSSPLPKKKDGTVERSLEVGFSMKDLN